MSLSIPQEQENTKISDSSSPTTWTGDTAMPFGKFRGKKLSEVPAYYLRFLCNYEWDETKEDYVPNTSKKLSFYGSRILTYLLDDRLCFHCATPLLVDEKEDGELVTKVHEDCREKQRKISAKKASTSALSSSSSYDKTRTKIMFRRNHNGDKPYPSLH